MPEWSNGAVSKTVERFCVPRVRIPFSPLDDAIRHDGIFFDRIYKIRIELLWLVDIFFCNS